MKLMLLLLALITGLGIFEMARHRRVRARIPIRIHVNGTRGKSSVTRLIAAGLRGGGLRTLAKTTGSAARVIHPDGSELPVRRRGGPNIREQLRIFRRAAAYQADALVLECMAVRPDLQWTCEHRIVKATIGVITNARPDHLEVMGPKVEDVADSLAGTVPEGAKLFTSEDRFADVFAAKARQLHSEFHQVDPASVTREELDGFAYIEFADNLSLALAVCEEAGVPRRKALEGMWRVKPDIGALIPYRVEEDGKHVEFVNLFAANDPESTAYAWLHMGLGWKEGKVMALLNTRADRMRRAMDLAPLFGDRIVADHYLLIGERTSLVADLLRRQAVPKERIVDLDNFDAQTLWSRIMALCEDRATVVGLGNIGGAGLRFLDLLESKIAKSA